MKKSYLIISLFLLSIISFAQQNNGIKYQAIIHNSSNDIIKNTNVNIDISILENDINGNSIYAESFSPEANDYGLINLTIGKGATKLGDFNSIDWSKNYYVKIELDAEQNNNFEVISVSKLQYVPYSFFAEKSRSAVYADTALYVVSALQNKVTKIEFGPNGAVGVNTNEYIIDDLSKAILDFNISNYNNADSVILSVVAKSSDANTMCSVGLIDLNSNGFISNSKISTREVNTTYIKSNNILSNLPNADSNLSLYISSSDSNNIVTVYKAFLTVYHK